MCHLAVVLCNLGKITIPEEVLQKEGELTDEERALIEQVPQVGAKILEPAKIIVQGLSNHLCLS